MDPEGLTPETPPEGRCAYRFRYWNRPQEYCGRELDNEHRCEGNEKELVEETGGGGRGRFCFWHCNCETVREFKASGVSLVDRLGRALSEGPYLEGADLRDAHLEDADLGGSPPGGR